MSRAVMLRTGTGAPLLQWRTSNGCARFRSRAGLGAAALGTGRSHGRGWVRLASRPAGRGGLSFNFVDQGWLLVGSAVGAVGLGLVVRRRVGPIPRLSWLDAAMGGCSIGALAAALGGRGSAI